MLANCWYEQWTVCFSFHTTNCDHKLLAIKVFSDYKLPNDRIAENWTIHALPFWPDFAQTGQKRVSPRLGAEHLVLPIVKIVPKTVCRKHPKCTQVNNWLFVFFVAFDRAEFSEQVYIKILRVVINVNSLSERL